MTRASLTVAAASVVAAFLAAQLRAQSPSAPTEPTFEVASVKANRSGDQRSRFARIPGGGAITNMSLRNIIRNTYQLQNFQIVGGPEWINTERFDIVAKAAGDPAPEQLLVMMRALLADRFRLVLHRENRDMPVYALVMTRSDGRMGPQLRPAAVDCAALIAAVRGGAAPPPQPAAGERPMCGITITAGRMRAGGSLLADVARNLAPFTGRLVEDRTGLTDRFDLDLEWTPDDGVSSAATDGPPSLFTAVQEQLGLKLESRTAPVEVLVIDSAERPTED